MKKLILMSIAIMVTSSAMAVPTAISNASSRSWVTGYEWIENSGVGLAATNYYGSDGVVRENGGQKTGIAFFDGTEYDMLYANAGKYNSQNKGLWALSLWGTTSSISVTMRDLSDSTGNSRTLQYFYGLGNLEKYDSYYFGSENFGNNWWGTSFFKNYNPLESTDYLVTVTSGSYNVSAIIRVGEGSTAVSLPSPAVVPAPGAILLTAMGSGLVGWLRRRRSL